MKASKIIRIILELCLIGISAAGIISTAVGSEFMAGSTIFMYFTIQSNIAVALITAVFLCSNIMELLGKKGFINDALLMAKYALTVAITITFIVFFAVLAPLVDTDYLFSFDNASVHLIVPVLALCDLFIFDNAIKLNAKNCFWSLAMPMYYLLFFLIGIPLGFRYDSSGSAAPYFFLDYEQNGWLRVTPNSLGVVYCVLIMMAFVIGLGYLFLGAMKLRNRGNNSAAEKNRE